MKNDLPLAPMPNPKNMGITRELAKLLPYRMHLNVNGVTKTLNFTAYRPPHKYKDHYWHFTKLDWAHHLKAEEDMTREEDKLLPMWEDGCRPQASIMQTCFPLTSDKFLSRYRIDWIWRMRTD